MRYSNLHYIFLINCIWTAYCQALASFFPSLRRIRSIIPSTLPFSLPWYEEGLEFSCTGCGKCCQVNGDVWLAPEEITTIIQYMSKDPNGNVSSIDEFKKKYVKSQIVPTNKDGSRSQSLSWMCLKRNEHGSCIFLDSFGKCSIYDARPVQCLTYPFWPSLVDDPQAWREEQVFPDNIALVDETHGRHWSPDHGGCEGIGRLIDVVAEIGAENFEKDDLDRLLEHEKSTSNLIARDEIASKRKLARKHWKRFPSKEIKKSTWYL